MHEHSSICARKYHLSREIFLIQLCSIYMAHRLSVKRKNICCCPHFHSEKIVFTQMKNWKHSFYTNEKLKTYFSKQRCLLMVNCHWMIILSALYFQPALFFSFEMKMWWCSSTVPLRMCHFRCKCEGCQKFLIMVTVIGQKTILCEGCQISFFI